MSVPGKENGRGKIPGTGNSPRELCPLKKSSWSRSSTNMRLLRCKTKVYMIKYPMDHLIKGTSRPFLVLQIFLLYLIGHSSLSLHQSPARCWGRMSWFPVLSLFLWALQVQTLSWCGGHSSNTGISQWSLVTSAHPKALSRLTLSKSLTVDCQQRKSWLEQSMPLRDKKRGLWKLVFNSI